MTTNATEGADVAEVADLAPVAIATEVSPLALSHEGLDTALLQGEPDSPLMRGRSAGGPEDRACYSCCCGYVFNAPVSTTVSCPHCGVGQAW